MARKRERASEQGSGSWRSFRMKLFHGRDFRKLTPTAKLVFFFLKGIAGRYGVLIEYDSAAKLAAMTGLSRDEVETALVELETEVADRATGKTWVEREENVIWVVDGLKHEPAFRADNWPHCRGLVDHLASFPNLPILQRFRQHYAALVAYGEETKPRSEAQAEAGSPDDQPAAKPPTGGVRPDVAAMFEDEEVSPPPEVEVDLAPAPPPVVEGDQVILFPMDTTKVGHRGNGKTAAKKPRPATWLTPYLDDWKAGFDGDELPAGAAARFLKLLHDKHGVEKVRLHLNHYIAAHQVMPHRQYARIASFAQTFSAYKEPQDLTARRPVAGSANTGERGFLKRHEVDLPDLNTDVFDTNDDE
jgi:hypothetical protein